MAAFANGCGPANEQPGIAIAVESAVAEAGDGGVIDLADLVTIPWDAVYGFPGETTDEEISSATGADFGSSDDTRAPGDGLGIIVFVDDGSVVAWSILNRDAHRAAVRFDQTIYGRPTSRSDAVFELVQTDTTVSGLPLYRLRPLSNEVGRAGH
jgi:hypothetical protein